MAKEDVVKMKVIATVLMVFMMTTSIYAADSGQATPSAGVKQARMSQMQVIEVAKKFAQKEGRNLSKYQEPSARYGAEDSKWWVSFVVNPPEYFGGHFSITVDDKSGTAERLYRGR